MSHYSINELINKANNAYATGNMREIMSISYEVAKRGMYLVWNQATMSYEVIV